ncbi:MAG: iron-sulfur cluster loop [Candidatus Firestonebacteria bacterium]
MGFSEGLWYLQIKTQYSLYELTGIDLNLIFIDGYMNQEKIVDILVKKGKELFSSRDSKVEFTGNPEADALLNNLSQFPHAFVLGCIMNRQIRIERAWLIPYCIFQEIGGFEFERLLKTDLNFLKDIFKRKKLHRFNDIMTENFYSAIQLIHNEYKDDVSTIWKDNPKSATIVRRFLEFKGVGIKIASMGTNILARGFKIPMQDKICIDISPDVHAKRVFIRLGFLKKDTSNDELIFCAKELNPEYPGVFDFSVFEIGREWCRPINPDCKNCYLDQYCAKNI